MSGSDSAWRERVSSPARGMEQALGVAADGLDVVACPQRPEVGIRRQLGDERDQRRVADRGTGLLAQARDGLRGDRGPVGEERPRLRIEEGVAQQVAPGRVERRQRPREGVGRQDAEAAIADERRGAGPAVEQRLDPGPDRGRIARRGRLDGGREGSQVRASVGVEAQGAGQRVDHRRRRMPVASLLQAHQIRSADARQAGQLVAPQARHPAPATGGHVDLLGLDLPAPRLQERTEEVGIVGHVGEHNRDRVLANRLWLDHLEGHVNGRQDLVHHRRLARVRPRLDEGRAGAR